MNPPIAAVEYGIAWVLVLVEGKGIGMGMGMGSGCAGYIPEWMWRW